MADVRDESDRHGLRIVIDLKKDEMVEIILNQLYKFTSMEVTFGIIFLAIVTGWGQRVMLRGNFFWNRITRPVANVTLTKTPSLITRQRQNLGRTRSRG